VQMAIAVINSTYGEPIADYSHRVATAWGGGSADQDDGLLFVLALTDRRMRLEVGEGLEGVLPDGRAATLIDSAVPFLQSNDVDGALNVVVEGVYGRVSGLRPGAPRPAPSFWARWVKADPKTPLVAFGGVGAGLVALILSFAQRRSSRRTRLASTIGPAVVFVVLAVAAARVLMGAPEWFGVGVVASGIAYGTFAGYRARVVRARTDVVGVVFAAVLGALFSIGAFETGFDPAILIPLVLLSPMAWIVSSLVFLLLGLFVGVIWNRGGTFLVDAVGGMLPASSSSDSSGSSWSSSSQSSSTPDHWSSTSSSSSDSSSSSSSSSSSVSYSGGGGSFGGGGASGSW